MKRIASIIFVLIIFTFAGIKCCAEDTQSNALDDYSDVVSEGISSAIDDDTKSKMQEEGIDGSSLTDITLKSVISVVWDEFTENLVEPIKVFARLIAVLILTAIAKSFSPDGSDDGVGQTFTIISLLGSMAIIYSIVYEAFDKVCVFLNNLLTFMLSYVPIFASVTAASGGYTVGGGYYTGVLCVCEIVSFCTQNVIMPFLSLFLALSFTSAINPDMRFSSAAESVKNAVKLVLNALMLVFTGLMTVQSFSSASTDGAAAKAVRFGATSFIPIIGSSVSESYSSVYASIGIIRSSVGSIGIIVIGVMLLNPLVTLICVRATIQFANMISELLGLSTASELLQSVGYAISAAISTTVCFSVMFIISTAIVMMASANLAS
ncbi:MAG: stage III sporulation protein AE [Ruminococcus sp.]|nr:stage III sporulation protein AE [Ruminococcus sp.]